MGEAEQRVCALHGVFGQCKVPFWIINLTVLFFVKFNVIIPLLKFLAKGNF